MNHISTAIQAAESVRLAIPTDYAQIKDLWQTIFHDEREYIECFFSLISFDNTKNQIVVKLVDQKVASMMFLLECNIYTQNRTTPCFYIFAVATHPNYQGNGYMKQLEKFSCDYAIEHGVYHLTLVPQGKSLFKLYAKIGYTSTFFHSHKNIYPISHSQDIFINKLSCDDFIKMRKVHLSSLPYSCGFSDDINSFLCYDITHSGIIPYHIRTSLCSGYACMKVNSSVLEIYETSIPDKHHNNIFGILANYYNCINAELTTPVSSVTNTYNYTNTTAYGMQKNLDYTTMGSKDGYMNFMLL